MSGNTADGLKGGWDWIIPDKGVCEPENKVCEQSSATTHMVWFFLTTSMFQLRSSKQIKPSLTNTHLHFSFVFFALRFYSEQKKQTAELVQRRSDERWNRCSALLWFPWRSHQHIVSVSSARFWYLAGLFTHTFTSDEGLSS